MATFSFGTGVVPGAPGTYINEVAGNVAIAGIASFNTTYMLVETEEDVSTTVFPFNRPIPVSSLADYKLLVGGVPETRIPLLSYNCVNSFFSNAQVGDLRVVRVGTPNQIVELEILPSGTKYNSSSLPSELQAGDVVYVQLLLNGLKLVAGDGSSGYTADGEWLGVPVIIPVDYIAGDEVNNRKISAAIVKAISDAIESNPNVSSSVYVRSFGLVNDLNPSSNSQNGYVTLAATTYNGNISVIPEQLTVGAAYILMQNAYDVENIVGLQNALERVPQDYIQCIDTAFDGQTNQGYIITPTAYAQFDAEGRTKVGAAAAAHAQSPDFKWMSLADPGPYLVTDVNKYKEFVPHQPAEDLETGNLYLVDNSIYEWTGVDVNYDRLKHQGLVPGYDPQVAIEQSVEAVAVDEKVGLLDLAVFTANSASPNAELGVFTLDSNVVWPVDYQIQEVTLSAKGADFSALPSTVYFVAPPYDSAVSGPYPSDGADQYVYIAETASQAVSILTEVTALGGTAKAIAASVLPADAFDVPAPTGSTVVATYTTPQWNLPVEIEGQSSNLVQNISGNTAYVNTLHLPGSLQDSTKDYRLSFVSRTLFDPSSVISSSTTSGYTGAVEFGIVSHNLVSGQKLFFTQPVLNNSSILFKATSKTNLQAYFVKVIDPDHFVLSSSSANYLAGSYIPYPSGSVSISTTPTIVYTAVSGGDLTATNLAELTTVPFIRGRKYGFASGTIANEAASDYSFSASGDNPVVSIYLNSSSLVLGKERVFPYGETDQAGWLPKLSLVNPGSSTSTIDNFLCSPTVNQSFATEAYLVPAIEAIYGGDFDASAASGIGPIDLVTNLFSGSVPASAGTYTNVVVTGGSGSGAKATVVVDSFNVVTSVTITDGGNLYDITDTGLGLDGTDFVGFSMDVGSLVGSGNVTANSPYSSGAGTQIGFGDSALNSIISNLVGVYFDVTGAGTSPDGVTPVNIGDRISVVQSGSTYEWVVVPPDADGGDMSTVAHVCYGTQVELSFTPEQTPSDTLWRFDAITSTEIIDLALRGVGFGGEPQAVFVEAGVDSVDRLFADSQRYFNAFGFIAFYGSYVENAAGQFIPPSAYVTGVATRRYRAEGFQFPPAGTKYQLSDAIGVQIPINSAQQNLLNPDGCNAVRSLPGYPTTAVFIWGGRTRINKAVAEQRKFQFVNTRVIQNVVYGSLRNAFDNQIFSVVDGFGVVFNQIVSIGNSVLSQLYLAGALYGRRPSDAFQIICDDRINRPENLENGLVYVKVFDTPVPTLERIEVDLIRVSIGQMNRELESQGLS